MIAAKPPHTVNECEQILDLLSRLDEHHKLRSILKDAEEIHRLLSLYSFHSSYKADQLYVELSSRYRKEFFELYGNSVLSCHLSSSSYLRLEQLLSLLARAAVLRLSQVGILSLSRTQIIQSDGMLLYLLKKEMQQKTGG